MLFDADGTRQVARQRHLVQDDQHPPVRRRLDKLCAPGYPGRKRGEVVRTRSTVQQAHTREWLGTFGAAGNGDAFGDLELACKSMVRYLRVRGLCPQQGVVRLDGLYGYVRGASVVQQQGLRYVMRTADYRLLQEARVQQALAQPPLGLFEQPDTGTVREVFEVGALDWVSADQQQRVCCRLLMTRRAVDKQRPHRVGKRQGDFVVELFASDCEAQGLSALDLLSLYFARGGFEQTLAEEDLWAEAQAPTDGASLSASDPLPDADSSSPAPPAVVPAQAEPVLPRAAPTQEPSPPLCPAPVPAESTPCPPQAPPLGQVAPATGRGSGRFAGAAFVWTEQQLHCPAVKRLTLRECTVIGARRRLRYQARTTDCATCPMALPCRGSDAAAAQGRRITVWSVVSAPSELPLCHAQSPHGPGPAQPSAPLGAPPSSAPLPSAPRPPESAPLLPAPPPLPPLGSKPVWWDDVPATALRRLFHRQVFCQRLDVPPAPPTLAESVPLTRARRAHRRLTWQQRQARNAAPPRTQPWKITLCGIPAGLASYLAGLVHPA